MKRSPRVVAAVVLALLCAGAMLFFFWWQLKQETSLLSIVPQESGLQQIITPFVSDVPVADPRDAGLYYLRQGDLLALRSQWQDARDQYLLSVQSDGGLPALRKLALAQLMIRDTDGVRDTIRRMQRRGARPQDLLLLEVRVLLHSGELEKAVELLENADDSPQRSYGLALLSILQGLHEKSQLYLQDVVSGWDPQLRNHARVLQNAYDEFSLFPESTDVHLVALLSRALAEVQECELALPLLDRVTNVQPDYRDAWIVRGYCQLSTQRIDQAITSLQKAYGLDPQKPEIQYFLGQAYVLSEDYRNAITYYEYALLNGFVGEAEVRLLIADASLRSDQPQLALEQYNLLLAMDETSIAVYQGLIETYMSLGQLEKARSAAKDVVDLYPERGEAHQLLGLVSLHMEREDEARIALKKALELNPYLPEAQELLQSL